MFFTRVLLVFILCFLLLSPFIKTLFNKIEKPIIIIAQDNSSSILMNKDSMFYSSTYKKNMAGLINKLSQQFNVRTFSFGELLKETFPFNYKEKITNISNVFDEIDSKFYNQNVGALILASDGLYNQGANPLYNSTTPPFTVYTIALGDTTIQRDIILKEVNCNKITFLKNRFPIEIFAIVNKANGKKTHLKIIEKNQVIFDKEYNINSDVFSISETVLLDAKNVGIQHYQVQLTTIDNEISTVNNHKNVYIEVLDGRQNILLLANAPHPDLKALKLCIESNENYKVTTTYYSDFDNNLKPYSLVIVHQIPENLMALNQLNKSDVSVLYITGTQTKEKSFNDLNLGVNISNSKGSFNDILATLNPQFSLFTLSENTIKTIKNFPPLIGSFGTFQLKTNGYSLLNQKIGNVETNNPLLLFTTLENKKNAILFGEGIWKWKMQEFLTNKNNDATNEIINKTIQFLAVKDDKNKFKIILEKTFWENEEIVINAELYNDSYELVNTPDVTISFADSSSGKYNFMFNKTSKAYTLNAKILPPGNYHYTASTKLGDKLYVKKGEFQILPLIIEANNTIADIQLLQNLAHKFGGTLFLPNKLDDLADAINNNKNIASIIYEEQEVKEWIHIKWIFLVLIILLSIEWYLRKRNGAY